MLDLLNKRVIFNKSTDKDNAKIGTIRYIGTLCGRNKVWYGIEWDDSKFGNSNGVIKSTKYFDCLNLWNKNSQYSKNLTSASFISQKLVHYIKTGRSFFEALENRYYACASDFCIKKVSFIDLSKCEISYLGKNIRNKMLPDKPINLSLSENLIENFDELMEILNVFYQIEDLYLNNCNFYRAKRRPNIPEYIFIDKMYQIFTLKPHIKFFDIKKLHLKNSKLEILDFSIINSVFPNLEYLDVSDNPQLLDYFGEMCLVLSFIRNKTSLINLKTLHIQNCEVYDFEILTYLLNLFPNLSYLNISQNRLSTFNLVTNCAFNNIVGLCIEGNGIARWSDYWKLITIFYNLQNLYCSYELLPTYQRLKDSQINRNLLISMNSNLKKLNGSLISFRERKNAELHILSLCKRRELSLTNNTNLFNLYLKLKEKYEEADYRLCKRNLQCLVNLIPFKISLKNKLYKPLESFFFN